MVRRSPPPDAPVVSHRPFGPAMVLLLLIATRSCLAAELHDPATEGEARPRSLRSLIWCWGNPEMATDDPPTLATFATASPAMRARLLGVPNVIMAGNGLPDDQQTADTLTQQVAQSPRLVWEIVADGGAGPPFVYDQRIAQVRKLVGKYPQIEGVLLDDMSSIGIDKGFRPQHIRRIRQLLGDAQPAVKIWGVLYTMNFNRPGIKHYVQELDVINLWTWHAKDVVDLEKNVAYCEHNFPGKPIVLGLYLYDYGAGRRMPPTLLEKQCVMAQRLAHAGRIEGIVLLTITNDPEAVGWAADWVGRVGDEPVVN